MPAAQAAAPNEEDPRWAPAYVQDLIGAERNDEILMTDQYVYALTLPTVEIPKTKPVLDPKTYCSCVQFAKAYSHRSGETWGNARDMKPLVGLGPVVGALVLTRYASPNGWVYHVAVVTEVGDGWIRIVEANYITCQRGTRVIPVDSSEILGYKPVV